MQNNILPACHHLEWTFQVTKDGTDHITSCNLHFFLIHRFFTQVTHFPVYFFDGCITDIPASFRADHKSTLVDMIHHVTVNAIGVPLLFPDICHQSRAEESTEKGIQYNGFLEIRMLPVREVATNTYSGLNTLFIIDNSLFPYCGRLHGNNG